ncbi:MAG: glycoside hydrolase family 2 TIM barrel-domain containing protein [Saprospiraceae bacterium]
MRQHSFFLALVCLFFSCKVEIDAPNPARPKVEIRKTGNSVSFFRDGQPFRVKGIAGWSHLEEACEAGANSIRTYTTDNLGALLDQAHALGMTVMAGIYIGRAIEGFDYGNAEAVEEQKKWVKQVVEKHKDHPALLCWAAGNEPDNGTRDARELWPALNDLIRLIRETDPGHPVTVVIEPGSVKELVRNCPDVDFISINTFANLPNFVRSYEEDLPYLITELGPQGPWEAPKTGWEAPIEPTMEKKMEMLETYFQLMEQDSSRCLGSYVFFWGQKQEFTHTWFNFFLDSGEKNSLADLMHRLWSHAQPRNHAPILGRLEVEELPLWTPPHLHTGKTYTFFIQAFDPEWDPLRFEWEIVPDGPFHAFIDGRGKVEVKPPALKDLDAKPLNERFVVTLPDRTGPFRVFVKVTDGQGNGAAANLPVFFVNPSLTGG